MIPAITTVLVVTNFHCKAVDRVTVMVRLVIQWVGAGKLVLGGFDPRMTTKRSSHEFACQKRNDLPGETDMAPVKSWRVP